MNAIERAWWTREAGPWTRALLLVLAPLEWLFRAGVVLRAWAYERGILPKFRAASPVVSVGNVALGGAGKTPVTLAIASRLLARGRRVAILSRGYGAKRSDARIVSDGRSRLLSASEAGDEPAMLARRMPEAAVLCGPRRAVLAEMASGEMHVNAFVLDDGFQHRALERDLDVVVIDASNPFGNGRLLPRGPNREPLGALGRAGLVWLSHADEASKGELERLRALARESTGRAPVESRHAPVDVFDGSLERSLGLSSLRGVRALMLCGIARPEGFRRTVESLGATVVVERLYPDHHVFREDELDEAFRALGKAECAVVVLTEKDAVRLTPARAFDPRLRVIRVDAEILSGEDELDAAIGRALEPAPGRLRMKEASP